GRVEANKGRGIIRDPNVWERVLTEVIDAASALDVGIMGVMVSPLRGADGNTEFLLHARVGQPSADKTSVLVSAAVAEAGDTA
ncbi:MAG: TlyA family rRNA (cytidine-2'-O)-methyltransferase, partial [Actinomycetota bacterium]|nr:TlyA family rRNA (cytidine-2'-O)-methyltransferase [Actinomycetota bacterium]